MKERPILFSAPMVRAILDGSKTMTRRVITNLPELNEVEDIGGWYFTYRNKTKGFQRVALSQVLDKCPYGKVGDRLWVKETWQAWTEFDTLLQSEIPDCMKSRINYTANGEWDAKKRSARFMPRWASRILLEVVSIKVERLQDISEEDAVKEGIYLLNVDGGGYKFARGEQEFDTAKEAFADLWDSINAKKGFGWDANPFVWVIEFRRAE